MTRPRSSLVSLETTPYYHCISRCVRRAFLFGKDHKGRSFDHRKPWLVERLQSLGDIFAINIAAYAVMSNHYHLVLHVDKDRADNWPEEEVLQRWGRLYKGSALFQRYQAGAVLSDLEKKELSIFTRKCRNKLHDISRFMACMNYTLAIMANREDGCTGRFWEGRFKSQALKDETALLACMAYVDLNPIRAGIATNLDDSDFTSIQDRILRVAAKGKKSKGKPRLMPFSENEKESNNFAAVPYSYKDYVELVDWYGSHVHPRKRGFIKSQQPRMLAMLGLTDKQWQLLSQEIQKEASTMLHGLEKLEVIERRAAKNKAA